MNHSEVFAGGGLYAIADVDAAGKRGLCVLECVRAMLQAGVPIIQLRAKGRSSGEQMELLDQVCREACNASSLIIQNDRADLASLAGAAGVHVGQEDLAPSDIRLQFPELLCGLSTHSLPQLEAALRVPALDYVALGPIFETQSKQNPEATVGQAVLMQAHSLCLKRGVPLVAIGGVDEESLAGTAVHCEYIAAISALLPSPGTPRPYSVIEERCKRWQSIIVGQQRVKAV